MRVITVGTSKITSQLIRAFKKCDIEVFCCVSRSKERAEAFAKDNGVEYYADDYAKVLRSKEFDFVYLGVPNSLHYEYAKLALENDKNVIVEKPFATTLSQAKELIDLANSRGLYIFDATMTMYNPLFGSLKKDIESIGPVKVATVNFSQYSSRFDAFRAGELPNIFNPKYAGGALNDLGIYCICFAVGLFGLPKSVDYVANVTDGIDTSGTFVLKYADKIVNGVIGKDAMSNSHFLISGEKGYITSLDAPSLFSSYQIHLTDGEKDCHLDNYDQYVSELRSMKMVYEYKNREKMNRYLTWTLMSISVLEKLKNRMK